MKKKQPLSTAQEILQKVYHYCSYRERCRQEVAEKMQKLGVSEARQQEILARLQKENLINQQRYAEMLTASKFRQNRWGRRKIKRRLQAKDIPSDLIDKALKEIEETTYRETLTSLLQQKLTRLRGRHPLRQKEEAARFVIQKGYEPGLVWEVLEGLVEGG